MKNTWHITDRISKQSMRTKLYIFIALIAFAACEKETKEKHAHSDTTQYVCAMHPQIIQNTPGTCPICGMDLVRATATNSSSNDLMLSDSQIRLANITTQAVTKRSVGQTIVLNGRISVDEQKREVISSRAAGRIEKLFIKQTGETVKHGQPLYVLYSETLLTLQQEYLLAKEQYRLLGTTNRQYKSFLDAAERKLLRYGLTKNQIDKLNANSLQPQVTFLAPASGIITEINAAEGQYVNEGALLYKLDDISTLWVDTELYPGEQSYINIGDRVTVRINGVEKNVDAQVSFLSPEYRNNSQITMMRASLNNPEHAIKPGQFAQVYLTHSTRNAIAIPVDAVIRDGDQAHVYLQTAHNTFKPQMVKIGTESFDMVEITEGLTAGDTVVVSGAYLLYSEIILKKGIESLANHNHQ